MNELTSFPCFQILLPCLLIGLCLVVPCPILLCVLNIKPTKITRSANPSQSRPGFPHWDGSSKADDFLGTVAEFEVLHEDKMYMYKNVLDNMRVHIK